MNKPLTFFRTAAGSPPSASQYVHLRNLGHRVIAGDCADLSSGFCFADASYVLPRVNAPGYVDVLLDICRKEGVNVFLPALDEELLLVAEQLDRFSAIGTQAIVSSPATLRMCVDKWETFNAFTAHGIPTIPTVLASDAVASVSQFPAIVKPRRGRGSSSVFIARDREELSFFRSYVPDAVIQPFIAGIELTIDVLADRTSTLKMVSPRKRLATDSGISSKGITHWDDRLVDHVRTIVARLGIVGPANIQCFLAEDGSILFSEINARLAGTCILSIAAGVPLFEGICDLALGEPVREWLQPSPPKILLRYWSETYVALGEVIAKAP